MKVLMEFAGLYIASMVAFVGIIAVGVHVFKTRNMEFTKCLKY